MARKPMTPQEYVDWYNRLPTDDTPLPESYVDRLQAERDQLAAIAAAAEDFWHMFVLSQLDNEPPQIHMFSDDITPMADKVKAYKRLGALIVKAPPRDSLQAENERLRAFVEGFIEEAPTGDGDYWCAKWIEFADEAAALLASLPAGGAADAPDHR